MSLKAFLDEHPVFSREEFARAHAVASLEGGERAADKALAYYSGTGRLVRVKRGVYAVVPPGRSLADFRVDAYLVASRLAPDAVVSHHSALQLHGLAQSVWSRHSVSTLHKLREVEFQGASFVGVSPPKALVVAKRTQDHVMTVNRSGLDVRVTDLERTVVDALDRTDLCGGWEEVWRSLEHLRVLDAPAAVEYALLLRHAGTASKLGFLLDVHRDELFVHESTLEALREALPRHIHRVDRRHAKEFRVIPRWRLAVPAPLFDPAWAELR